MAGGLPVQRLTDDALWARVAGQARCADSGLAPDQWYPVSIEPTRARCEAAAAIAVCTSCPVRAECLELSLRHWDIGQHGVWGGLVATDRAQLQPQMQPRMPETDPRGEKTQVKAEPPIGIEPTTYALRVGSSRVASADGRDGRPRRLQFAVRLSCVRWPRPGRSWPPQ
jgi:Transcription factor WhiB